MLDNRYSIEVYKLTLAIYDKELKEYVQLKDGQVEQYVIPNFEYGTITQDLSIDDLLPIPK